MNWTSQAPKIEGWYWWRKRPGKVPIITFVEESDNGGIFFRRDVDEEVPNPGTFGGGEWCGPLIPPIEE